MTETPRLPRRQPKQPEFATVPAALMAGVVCAGAFFGLLAFIFPGIGFLGIAVLLLGVILWIQYVVWGKWIYSYAVRKEQEADAAEREAAALNGPHRADD